MPRYEFRCTHCERAVDVFASFDEPTPNDQPCTDACSCGDGTDRPCKHACPGTLRRVYGVIAIGAGSSGEPPRAGRQRFVKGDAGWTHG